MVVHHAPSPIRHFELTSVLVSYEHRADRYTVAPRDCPSRERAERWLSADANAFVALSAMR